MSNQPTTDAQEIVIKHVESGGKLDLDSLRELRNTVRGRLGDHAATEVFEFAEGGGAVSLAQLEGLSYYDPQVHVPPFSSYFFSPLSSTDVT